MQITGSVFGKGCGFFFFHVKSWVAAEVAANSRSMAGFQLVNIEGTCTVPGAAVRLSGGAGISAALVVATGSSCHVHPSVLFFLGSQIIERSGGVEVLGLENKKQTQDCRNHLDGENRKNWVGELAH